MPPTRCNFLLKAHPSWQPAQNSRTHFVSPANTMLSSASISAILRITRPYAPLRIVLLISSACSASNPKPSSTTYTQITYPPAMRWREPNARSSRRLVFSTTMLTLRLAWQITDWMATTRSLAWRSTGLVMAKMGLSGVESFYWQITPDTSANPI